MTRRVAVTGIGVISALGPTVGISGRRWPRAQRDPAHDAGARRLRSISRTAPRPPDYRAADHFDEKDAGFLDRFAQFAAVAAREAVADADDRSSTAAWAETTAIVTGSCIGGQDHRRRRLPRSLRAEKTRVPAAHDSQSDGQRGRQPHFSRIRHHRAGVHRLDRVLLRESRHRPGVLDGAQRRRGSGHRRRQRSALLAGLAQSPGRRCAWFRPTPAARFRATAAG